MTVLESTNLAGTDIKAHGEIVETDEIVRHMTDLETNLALVLKGTQQMIVDLKKDLVQKT